jgi:hypothetical protein
MRKTLATAALLLAFSFPALAGEMGTPGSPAPPPTADGIMQNDAADSLTQVALDLLAALSSLF